jgi:hypothetical protein
MLRGDTGSGSIGAGSAWLLFFIRVGLLGRLGNGLGILLILIDGPIEDVVVLETLTNEEITEDLSEIRVVGLVIERRERV